MKLATSFFIGALFCIVSTTHAAEKKINFGDEKAGDFKNARTIIDKKCTSCHSKEKIDIALTSGKDMSIIQKEMEKRGARLTSNERDVLGIFWKQSKPVIRK